MVGCRADFKDTDIADLFECLASFAVAQSSSGRYTPGPSSEFGEGKPGAYRRTDLLAQIPGAFVLS